MSEIPMAATLRHHAKNQGESSIALISGNQLVSWAELERGANLRANWLRHAGVRQGDYVSVILRNGVEFFESTFAIWKVGATPNPIPISTPRAQLRDIFELLNPAAVISDEGRASDIPFGTILEGADGLSAQSSDAGEELVSPSWKAILSGGSTGTPKIIVDKQPAVVDPAPEPGHRTPVACTLNPGPLYHNAPFLFSHQALFAGRKLVSMDRFDASDALALIEKYRVDWVNFVPTMMHRIWRLPPEERAGFDLSSLRTVFHMASAMPTWLKEEWIAWLGPDRVWELYGGTERQGTTIISGREWLERPGSVGRVTQGSSLKIIAADGRECAPGEIGEIFFLPETGQGSTYKYLGATPIAIEGGWESLGDLGYIDEDGYLFLADRKADLIIRGGANIYPAEVETALDEHPSIKSALVIGIPDPELGETVHAICQVRGETDPSRLCDDLITLLSRRLPPSKFPASIELTDESLRDDAGKARRSAARADRLERLARGDDSWRSFLRSSKSSGDVWRVSNREAGSLDQ